MNEKNRFVGGAIFTNEKIELSLSQNRSGKAENLNVGSTGNIVVGAMGNVFGLGVGSELVRRKSRCKVF